MGIVVRGNPIGGLIRGFRHLTPAASLAAERISPRARRETVGEWSKQRMLR